MHADDWLRPGWEARDLEAPIAEYRARGFAVLPDVVSPAGLAALRERSDDLMLGRVDIAPFFFQHDAATGRYEDLPLGEGWVGPSLAYRKIEKLERDPRFYSYLTNPIFERIARRVLAPGAISIYRAILMTKPARAVAAGGTDLPWHQDGGQLWGLSRDLELQLWTALDDAPVGAGCMRVAVGTHRDGPASPLGGVVPAARVAVAERQLQLQVEQVPARAGDVVLLHNLVWHASGLNLTEHPRRAFSVCFLDAATHCVRRRRAARRFAEAFAPPAD